MRSEIIIKVSEKTLLDGCVLTPKEYRSLDHYEAIPTNLEDGTIGFTVKLFYK